MQVIDLAQKFHDERRGGLLIHLRGAANLLDTACIHDDHAIGHFQRLILIVRHKDAGDAHLVVDLPQPAAQFLAHFRVQRAKGFVQQQQARLRGQCARQSNALALAAR